MKCKLYIYFTLSILAFNLLGAQKIDKNKIPNKNTEISENDTQILKDLDNLWSDDLNSTLMFSNYKHTEGEVIQKIDEETLRARLKDLDDSTPFEMRYNKVVHAYIERYLRSGNSLGRMMGLAEYYFPLFEEKLSKYEIPLEIKNLAVVESWLRPTVKSPVGAKGLWQFMYATGKIYDLEVNSYVDARYDPIRSTDAACKMLKQLHKRFGDWNLALAAYNYGPGNINKAIRRSGGLKNYWKLRRFLPKETQGYVPKFIAINYIMTYYKEHNIKPRRLETRFFDTDTVHVKRKLTFQQISKHINIQKEELEFLNPIYKLGVVPFSSKKNYYLRLPKEIAKDYTHKEKYIYALMDALIMAKGRALPKGKKMNYAYKPKIKHKTKKTIVAKKISPKKKVAKSEKYKKKKTLPKKRIIHSVTRGETLGGIANYYRVKASKIKAWNNLKSSKLKIRQKLKIYGSKVPLKSINKFHTVKRGENLTVIARKNKISIDKLKKLNRMKGSSLKIGQKLKVK